MRFSEAWLRESIDTGWSTTELVAQLTMAGLEVDGVESLACSFEGVVVGEIVSIEAHPDSSKLRVCSVVGGTPEPQAVVCGAANARPGLKVAYATVGAVLPEGRKIDSAWLRGVESRGMLCSEAELGISSDAAGLMELADNAPVGVDLHQFLQLDDNVIAMDLTPNRGDCLSIRGMAREIGAISGRPIKWEVVPAVTPVCGDRVNVDLLAPDACPRYCGRVVRNIDATKSSPFWLQERLRRSGIRAINPVVDVTNYVMLELGQPMHAFDLETLSGDVRVRLAEDGERIKLLDGGEVQLDASTLVIADHDKSLAIAGIMGGYSSAVTATTRHVFLEGAHFSPLAIAGRARRYGLHTDSSHRFERGVDPDLVAVAMERATCLLLDIAGGEPGPVVVAEVASSLPQRAVMPLRKQRLRQQLAMNFDDDWVLEILGRVGVEVVCAHEHGWSTRAPSWRFDLAIEADLVEELARIYGYGRLPINTPLAALAIAPLDDGQAPAQDLRRFLATRDYLEAITYSFIDPELQLLMEPTQAAVKVTNPISVDMAVMRTGLWPGLLSAMRFNRHRQRTRIRLFETGQCFRVHDGNVVQEYMLAGLITGRRWPETWADDSAAVDFYDIKGDVVAVLDFFHRGTDIGFVPIGHPALHPGQAAGMVDGEGKSVGCAGKLHPLIARQLGIDQDVFLFQLALERLTAKDQRRFEDISRFPRVRRDLAMVVDRSVSASALLAAVRDAAGELLIELNIFDVYEGKHIENNRKSIAFGLIFQHDLRTLTEAEIGSAMNTVIQALKDKFAASVRGEQ